jgi:hypothetical protein
LSKKYFVENQPIECTRRTQNGTVLTMKDLFDSICTNNRKIESE